VEIILLASVLEYNDSDEGKNKDCLILVYNFCLAWRIQNE